MRGRGTLASPGVSLSLSSGLATDANHKGKKMICPSHSPSWLQSAKIRMSSTACATDIERGASISPGMGCPDLVRSFAKPINGNRQ